MRAASADAHRTTGSTGGSGHVDLQGSPAPATSARTRAAANSMANGIPSSRPQISATTAALSLLIVRAGLGQAGAVGEQLDGRIGHDSDGTRQRPPHPTTPIGSRLVASTVSPGAPAQQEPRPARHWRPERVRSYPGPPACDGREQTAAGYPSWAAGLVGQPQRTRYRHRHHRRMCDRRQIDIPNTITELRRDASRDLNGETGLARTASSCQSHQPVIGTAAGAHHQSLLRVRPDQ